nr:AEC family transporter [Hathewaya massiliensis]
MISMMIIIFFGFMLTKKGWYTRETSKNLIKIVVNFSIPCMMFNTVVNNFNRETLISTFNNIHVPFVSIGVSYLVAIIYCRIFRIHKNRGLFKSMFFNSNTIFMGIPINLALFGEDSLPYVLIYYVANTMFFWTFGVYEISLDNKKLKAKNSIRKTLKNIFSPALLGFVFAILFTILNIKLPKAILDSSKYLGSLTTPVAMLFIGESLYYTNLKKLRFTREVIGVLLGRFIISPLILLGFAQSFNVESFPRNIFFIQAAMPVMTNTAIIAEAYEVDGDYAALMIALTTVGSLIMIPLYIFFLTYIIN